MNAPLTPTGLAAAAERIKLLAHRAAVDVWQIGKELITVRDSIPVGDFGAWIEDECELSRSAAYRFISVAETFPDESPTLGRLSPAAVFELAAPSTPESVVQDVQERMALGETVTADEVKRLKAAKRAAEKTAKDTAANLKASERERKRLLERVTDLQDEVARAAEPGVITVTQDDSAMERIFEGFVDLFRGFPHSYRERFFAIFPTPFSAPLFDVGAIHDDDSAEAAHAAYSAAAETGAADEQPILDDTGTDSASEGGGASGLVGHIRNGSESGVGAATEEGGEAGLESQVSDAEGGRSSGGEAGEGARARH